MGEYQTAIASGRTPVRQEIPSTKTSTWAAHQKVRPRPVKETTEPKSRKGIGGPKTKEGKERVRLNALKMGLHARSLEGMQAVADVVGVAFEDVLREMRDYHQPADPLEETLVRRIARCTWKLMVIETIEDHALRRISLQNVGGSSLETLSVIERRSDVQLHRAIQALALKRNREQENAKNKLPEALLPSVAHAQLEPESDSSPMPSNGLAAAPGPSDAPGEGFPQSSAECTSECVHSNGGSSIVLPTQEAGSHDDNTPPIPIRMYHSLPIRRTTDGG